jgi:hypothetical protein
VGVVAPVCSSHVRFLVVLVFFHFASNAASPVVLLLLLCRRSLSCFLSLILVTMPHSYPPHLAHKADFPCGWELLPTEPFVDNLVLSAVLLDCVRTMAAMSEKTPKKRTLASVGRASSWRGQKIGVDSNTNPPGVRTVPVLDVHFPKSPHESYVQRL